MAWSNLVCAKLTQNPSQLQWHEWIAPDIGYTELCPGLPHRAGQRHRLTLSRLEAAPKLIHSSHDGPMNDVVHGHCDHRFGKIADALADEIGKGEELGASIALGIDGELVVDIWGGHADRAKTLPWGQDTIVNFFSCTKTLTALAALIAIDRGLVDAFAPVAKYWPEFADNGKQDIEVRHLLPHTSGVSGWEPPFSVEDIYDWRTQPASSRARHRGGHLEPHPAITRSTTATRSAR